MSGMFGALDAAASGAGLGRVWMDVIADNVANVNTVRPAGEEPFRAAQVEAQAAPAQDGVVVAGMRLKGGDPEVVYDPDNPLADSRGYVTHPQVDLSEEMTNMLIANRLYDANLSVMQQARESYQAALQIGKS